MEIEKESRNILIRISIFLVALAGILTSIDKIFNLGFWNKLFRLIYGKPERFWIKFGITYITVIVVILVISWLWRLNFVKNICDSFGKKKIKFFIQLISSIIILAIFSISLLWLFYYDRFETYEAKILFPQPANLGPLFIRTYASNGEAYYSFYDETPINGPEGYVTITLQAYGRTIEHTAGWVIFLLRGADISGYKQLRFLIRGERGGEIIGVKAKDAKGVEVSLMLDQRYLLEGKISTDWQLASIPFKDFGNVNFGLIDNFSFFVDGLMAETRPQTIFIGDFRLR